MFDRWHNNVTVHRTMYRTFRKFACIMFTNSTRGFAFSIRRSRIRYSYTSLQESKGKINHGNKSDPPRGNSVRCSKLHRTCSPEENMLYYDARRRKDVNHYHLSSGLQYVNMCALNPFIILFSFEKDHRSYFRPEDVPFGNLLAVGTFFLRTRRPRLAGLLPHVL